MTEYGRGEGSEPWHPEDPLYGNGGWEGQQADAGQQSPYGGQPQHYPQQPQQQYDNGGWDDGRQAAYLLVSGDPSTRTGLITFSQDVVDAEAPEELRA